MGKYRTGTKSKIKATDSKTQGDLLKELCDWYGKSMQLFADKINMSRKWLSDNIQSERIPQKHQVSICRALNIPIEYWSGNYLLPLNVSSDPDVSLKSTLRERELEYQLNECHKKYIDLLEKHVSLNEKLSMISGNMERLKREGS